MSTLDDIKEIADFLRKEGNENLFKKAMGIHEEIIKYNREETQLKIQLQNAKDKIDIHSKMIYKKPFYVQENDSQPFCAVCWENDHKAIHLSGPYGEVDSTKRYYSCHVCNNWFYV